MLFNMHWWSVGFCFTVLLRFLSVKCSFTSLLLNALVQESFDYDHLPGHAVLHRGRHRHGARATTSGHRANLIMWCRRYHPFHQFAITCLLEVPHFVIWSSYMVLIYMISFLGNTGVNMQVIYSQSIDTIFHSGHLFLW